MVMLDRFQTKRVYDEQFEALNWALILVSGLVPIHRLDSDLHYRSLSAVFEHIDSGELMTVRLEPLNSYCNRFKVELWKNSGMMSGINPPLKENLTAFDLAIFMTGIEVQDPTYDDIKQIATWFTPISPGMKLQNTHPSDALRTCVGYPDLAIEYMKEIKQTMYNYMPHKEDRKPVAVMKAIRRKFYEKRGLPIDDFLTCISCGDKEAIFVQTSPEDELSGLKEQVHIRKDLSFNHLTGDPTNTKSCFRCGSIFSDYLYDDFEE